MKSLVTCNHCDFDAFDRFCKPVSIKSQEAGKGSTKCCAEGTTIIRRQITPWKSAMDWDSLLSFCSLYLCTVLVYLLKQRFFTTETLCIDRVDVIMRATVLALFPNELMMQDIITVVEHMHQDITGIILPIANIVSDRMTEVSDIVIMITNFACGTE